MKPRTPSGFDTNPLLTFDSEGSAHEPPSSLIRRWLADGSKLRTLFDVFVGLAAAVGLGLALQQTSRSFDHSMRRSVAASDVTRTVPDTWLESHPVAPSLEPFRSAVLDDATTESVDAIDFDQCEIDVQGPRAVASCQGSARSLTAVGPHAIAATGRWRFSLRKVNNTWLIHEVDSH